MISIIKTLKKNIVKSVHDDRGSSAIFLTAIFAGFLLLIGILLTATINTAGKSYADATFQLSGRSILSEFDIRLYEEYGLFGFNSEENDVKNKFAYYINGTFEAGKTGRSFRLMDVAVQNISVNLKEFSLTDIEIFEGQIVEAAKDGFLRSIIEGENADGNIDGNATETASGRDLRNDIVWENLPSHGMPQTGISIVDLMLNGLPDISDLGSIGNSGLITQYIFDNFKFAVNGGKEGDTFFENEVEYILKGYRSDEKNYEKVCSDIKLLRIELNTVHILSDASKMKKITTIVAAVPPGGKTLSTVGIIALWAEREAQNDIELLKEGKRVALVKTSSNWALDDIDSIVEGSLSEATVYPPVDSGQEYCDYLKLFISLQDREMKLLRMMDLIQINLKGTYYRDFLLKEHYAGFRVDVKTERNFFKYVHKY